LNQEGVGESESGLKRKKATSDHEGAERGWEKKTRRGKEKDNTDAILVEAAV
jgi:hypothetical protein